MSVQFVLDRINIQYLLSISRIYNLESEQIKRVFSVRCFRAAKGEILWIYRVILKILFYY